MDIDITQHLGAISREVVDAERDGKPAVMVRVSRTYATDPADLWDALTTAERLPRWFLPITGDLRPGGRYQLEGNAGGEITVCEPPAHLSVTWEFDGDVSWVDVWLSDDPAGGTRFRLEHTATAGGEHWDQFGPGAVGIGWDLSIMGLSLHIGSDGAGVDHDEIEAWSTSPQAIDLMRSSNDGWCEADIARGTPEEVARAAAGRTIAAYTGAPPPEG